MTIYTDINNRDLLIVLADSRRSACDLACNLLEFGNVSITDVSGDQDGYEVRLTLGWTLANCDVDELRGIVSQVAEHLLEAV